MLESVSWSDGARSEVTEELGDVEVRRSVADFEPPNPTSFRSCTDFVAPSRQRCVVPKVQRSQVNRSDQRVPEYRDQTVPEWQAGGASSDVSTSSKRTNGRGVVAQESRFGGASSSRGEYNCCYCGRDDEVQGSPGGARRSNAPAEGVVNFPRAS